MKYFKSLVIVLIVGLFAIGLSGCGKDKDKESNKPKNVDKVLTCTKNIDKMKATSIFSFSGNKLVDTSIKVDMDMSKLSKTEKTEVKEMDLCTEINKAYSNALKNCKQTATDKKISIKGSLDITQYKKDNTNGIKDIKNSMIQQGFACDEE